VTTEAYAVCARRRERRDMHVAEALGRAAGGSCEQEAAAVWRRTTHEIEREDGRGMAKQPDPDELDVPKWAEPARDKRSTNGASPPGDSEARSCSNPRAALAPKLAHRGAGLWGGRE
jgi:hypothetical protein